MLVVRLGERVRKSRLLLLLVVRQLGQGVASDCHVLDYIPVVHSGGDLVNLKN